MMPVPEVFEIEPRTGKEVNQMALVRWDPVRDLDSLQDDMNRLFDRFFGDRPGDGGSQARRWMPAMDLAETENDLVLRADLPGMSEDDIDIEVKDGVLTVSGERKAEQEEKGEGYHRVERAFGTFSRSLSLPDGVDPDKVEAKFEDGVLEVRIPKPAETKPTRVQIGKGSVEGSGKQK
jgi:HSP20 family protein